MLSSKQWQVQTAAPMAKRRDQATHGCLRSCRDGARARGGASARGLQARESEARWASRAAIVGGRQGHRAHEHAEALVSDE